MPCTNCAKAGRQKSQARQTKVTTKKEQEKSHEQKKGGESHGRGKTPGENTRTKHQKKRRKKGEKKRKKKTGKQRLSSQKHGGRKKPKCEQHGKNAPSHHLGGMYSIMSSRCSSIHTGAKSITCASSRSRSWLHEFRMLHRQTLRPFCRVRDMAGMKSLSPVTKTFPGFTEGRGGGRGRGRGGGGGRVSDARGRR